MTASHPDALVLFGVTGDLAHKLLVCIASKSEAL
jgi:glucose-6-phosphate 1-dehydrogenase